MRARQLPYLLLLLLAFPAATASAKHHDKPVVETRTFQVRLLLSGKYQQAITLGEADGYCNGTGQALAAGFRLVSTAKLRVKLDTTKAVTAAPTVDTSGDWVIENAFIYDGDTCDQVQKSTCSGEVVQGYDEGNVNHAYAQGSGHHVLFGTDLQGPPVLKSAPADCRNDQMISPPTDFAGPPVAPYDVAIVGLKLVKLNEIEKGETLKRSYKPVKGTVDSSYDVPTCNHTPGCTASLTNFVHTLSIKRLK